jgi:hypothetical protein
VAFAYAASLLYGPSEAESLTEVWEPRLLDEITINQEAFNLLGLGGVIALTFAEIRLDNTLDWLAEISAYDLATGRECWFYQFEAVDPIRMDLGVSWLSQSPAFVGLVRGIIPLDDERMRLAVSDITENMQVPAQNSFYLGTGGLEGEATLKDKPRPICLGHVFNIAPIFLGNVDLGDGAKPTYQVNWRAVQEIDVVRIRGVEQTVTTGVPGLGQYKEYRSTGIFQLGSTPDGEVTADVLGDSAGPLGYVGTTSGIIRTILLTLGSMYADTKIDEGSFGFFELDLPGEIGLYQGAEEINVASLIERIASAQGVIVSGGRSGKIRLCDPLINTADQFEVDISDILEIMPVPIPGSFSPTPRVIELQWQPNWSPITNVAGSVGATQRKKLEDAASIVRVTSSIIQSRVLKNKTLKFDSLYWNESDALARAEQWKVWLERGVTAFKITTDRYRGQIELGYFGRVVYPKYGIDGGFQGVVVEWSENLSTGRLSFTVIGAKQ